MTQQGEYFKNNPNSNYTQLADNIKHPLNEFVKTWIEFGIMGPIILALLIITPFFYFKYNIQVLMIEVCLFLFCMFSYPLMMPLTLFVILIFPITFIFRYIKSNKIIKTTVIVTLITTLLWLSGAFYIDNLLSSATFYSSHKKHNRALTKYAQLHKLFSYQCVHMIYPSRSKVYLYNYARELFATSNFSESLRITLMAENKITNYDIQLLKADIFYHLNNYEKATKTYIWAYNMCPVRFGPLEGLLNCYRKQGNLLLEKQTAKLILEKKVKVRTNDILRIRNKASCVLHYRNEGNQETGD